MKRFTYLYYIVLSTLLLLTACQNDETTGQGGSGPEAPQLVEVRLHISPAGSSSADARTRADWRDEWATDDEMMNLWTVIIVDAATDAVKEIQSCKPTGAYTAGTDDDREVDIVTELPTGTYRFYSFANIGGSSLESLLGLPTGSVPVPTANDVIVKKAIGDEVPGNTGPISDLGHIYPRGSNNNQQGVATIEDRTIRINGNNFDPTADNNGFGAKGIPMSNVQTKEITSSTTFDLIVIRMLAKIEVDVYNDGETKATIHSISLTDVTPNIDNNLKLLPQLTLSSGADQMNYVHKNIRPNLGTTSKGNITYSFTTGNVVEATGHKSTGVGQTPVKFIFYVNESSAPGNGSGLFYLSLGIKTGTGDEVVYSHALINQKGKTTTDDDAWDYIARNDYRIIPVVLTDWQFRIEPIALAPIAGYPAMTLSSDGLKATFSTGGFIALQPYVKKRTDTEWRDFSNPEVQVQSVSWKTKGDATENPSGDDKMIKTPFAYDSSTHYIIGELNNNLSSGTYTTAVTVTVKLGPSGSQFTYSFTCDVILQVPVP